MGRDPIEEEAREKKSLTYCIQLIFTQTAFESDILQKGERSIPREVLAGRASLDVAATCATSRTGVKTA